MNVLWYNPSSQVNNCCDGGARLALTNEPSDQRRRTKRELLALVASVETEGFDSRIHDDDERTNEPPRQRADEQTNERCRKWTRGEEEEVRPKNFVAHSRCHCCWCGGCRNVAMRSSHLLVFLFFCRSTMFLSVRIFSFQDDEGNSRKLTV